MVYKFTKINSNSPDYHSKFTKEVRSLAPLRNCHEIRDDQEKVIKWMVSRESSSKYGVKGGILAVEPGLGKTFDIITLSLIQPQTTSTLLVVQKTLIGSTIFQIQKFYGKKVTWCVLHKDYGIYSSVDPKSVVSSRIKQYNFVITTYETLVMHSTSKVDQLTITMNQVSILKQPSPPEEKIVRGFDVLYGVSWDRVIFDETHEHLTNPKTKKWIAAFCVYGKSKWCVSGTHIKNKTSDFWAQLRICGYSPITNEKEWTKLGSSYYTLHSLDQFVYTQSYKEGELTKLNEIEIEMEFDSKSMETYKEFLSKTQKEVQLYEDRRSEYLHVFGIFTRLRQSCIDPSLTEVSYSLVPPKYKKVLELLRSKPKEKFLIFSSYVKALKGLCNFLEEESIKGMILSSDVRDRAGFLKEFEMSNNQVLCSTFKLGGTGLNLQFMNNVIILEPYWNEASIKQSYQRCWRPGQQNEVNVYYLTIKSTIEKKMYELCELKKDYRENFESHLEDKEKIRMDIETIKSLIKD